MNRRLKGTAKRFRATKALAEYEPRIHEGWDIVARECPEKLGTDEAGLAVMLYAALSKTKA